VSAPTCNVTVTVARYDPKRPVGQRKVPARICGKLATHTLPPNHALILCAEHAKWSWGSPPPAPIAALPDGAPGSE